MQEMVGDSPGGEGEGGSRADNATRGGKLVYTEHTEAYWEIQEWNPDWGHNAETGGNIT